METNRVSLQFAFCILIQPVIIVIFAMLFRGITRILHVLPGYSNVILDEIQHAFRSINYMRKICCNILILETQTRGIGMQRSKGRLFWRMFATRCTIKQTTFMARFLLARTPAEFRTTIRGQTYQKQQRDLRKVVASHLPQNSQAFYPPARQKHKVPFRKEDIASTAIREVNLRLATDSNSVVAFPQGSFELLSDSGMIGTQ